MPRVLCVHGYLLRAVDNKDVVYGCSKVVCIEVVKMHTSYDRIFLLGGGPQYAHTSIAAAMRNELLHLGVPEEKIFLRENVPELAQKKDPKDTVEEVRLMKSLQSADGWHNLHYYAIAVSVWTPRIKRVQKALQIQCITHQVNAHPPYARWIGEIALRFLSVFDPLGVGLVTGLPHYLVRHARQVRSTQRTL